MRRSSVLIMSIMLVAFGAMLAAAGSALKPLAEDADAARAVERFLAGRGDLAPDSRVRISRRKANEDSLATEGFGLVVQLEPAGEVCRRRGGLRAVAIRAVHESLQRFPRANLDWVELVMDVGTDAAPRELRALVETDGENGITEPTPPLPLTLLPSS